MIEKLKGYTHAKFYCKVYIKSYRGGGGTGGEYGHLVLRRPQKPSRNKVKAFHLFANFLKRPNFAVQM